MQRTPAHSDYMTDYRFQLAAETRGAAALMVVADAAVGALHFHALFLSEMNRSTALFCQGQADHQPLVYQPALSVFYSPADHSFKLPG